MAAAEEVKQRMLRTTAVLDAAGVPYAVIGGNAVATWIGSMDPDAVRGTKDVDILLRRDDLNAFLRFVEAVFQQRRKQLAGTLGRMNGLGSTQAAARLREAGVGPERRPQTLNLAEWESIYRRFAG